jgi:hypothetical protein
VEADCGRGVPDRGHQRDRRLHRAHQARIRRPRGRLPTRVAAILPDRVDASGAQLITIITTFIHLCEAYLGIAPHFHLWRQFFELKKTSKGVVVGSVSFMLRWNMKLEYIDLVLPDNTTS